MTHIDFTQDVGALAFCKPASGWRNKWLAPRTFRHPDAGITYGPGLIFGPFVYPSKDVAETAALEALEDGARRGVADPPIWLGAVPIEGARP